MIFLKLGGSLLTDKNQPRALRPQVLDRLCEEIASAFKKDGSLRLVLGHGSGSFGHQVASRHGTRQGVRTPDQWRGFAEVWLAASALNHLVLENLHRHQLPGVAMPPSAAAFSRGGQLYQWDLTAIKAALTGGLLPVVYGDVAFDDRLGGTILSTEELFDYLARKLRPKRILLAGREAGVWADYPTRSTLIESLTPSHIPEIIPGLQGADGADVTGGMAAKVQQMAALVSDLPGLEVWIFSGESPGALREALLGNPSGTCLRGAHAR